MKSLVCWQPLLSLSALLLAICCQPAAAALLAPPLISPPSEPPFTPLPLIPPEKTAYVAIHYEDPYTSHQSAMDSEASLDGIRVMMATVIDPARGASGRDRVVLVPTHTSEETRQIFAKDGLIVLNMDDRLPHNDICAPKFDRIYLWSRTLAERYERVVYLDWDVVVQRPTDELFLCGEHCMVSSRKGTPMMTARTFALSNGSSQHDMFCVFRLQVFNSVLHFVDGVMVVKPNVAVFEAMVERYKRDRLSALWGNSALSGSSILHTWRTPSKTMCWEKSYIFFLYWFGNIEAVSSCSWTTTYGTNVL
jgi:hypothetical protein